MINLLPTDVKQDIAYARKNAKLLQFSIATMIVMSGIAVITLAGLFYMQQSKKLYNKQIQTAQEEIKSQKLETVQKQAEDISNNLKLTTQVLSREVLFSKLLKQIGSAMPANTALSDLKISKTEGGIDLTAVASDYNTASQVQVNLSDSANKIFDKADILNITCTAGSSDPRYPCTVSIRARFGKNNSFLFISPTTTGAKS